eukprot:3176859-Prymnesium_polylepis.1
MQMVHGHRGVHDIMPCNPTRQRTNARWQRPRWRRAACPSLHEVPPKTAATPLARALLTRAPCRGAPPCPSAPSCRTSSRGRARGRATSRARATGRGRNRRRRRRRRAART